MPRAPLSVADSTVMLSCFVMGAELLLLFAYVRTQILVGVKRRVLSAVEAELLRDGRFRGAPHSVGRPDLERLHSAFCADWYGSSSVLAVLGYLLATVLLLSMLSNVRTAKNAVSSGPTLVASAAAGTLVFFVTQWGFLKLALLPFYSDLYDKVTGGDNPGYEHDPPGVTLTLLSPTLFSACVLLAASAVWSSEIDWGAVAFAAGAAVLGLATEAVSWLLMKGFAVPVAEIVSAVTDAITAVLWVNRSNEPQRAVDRLRESLFPDGSPKLTRSNILRHIYRDNFDRRKLEVDDHGALVLRRAGSERLRAVIMIACAACLLSAPFVAVALRAPALDAAVIMAQLLSIAAAYWIYVIATRDTATMKRLTAAIGL